MVIIFFTLFIGLGLWYYYDKRNLIVQIIKLYMTVMKWKIENYDWIKEDSIKYVSSSVLGKYTINIYDVMYNNKNQEVIFAIENDKKDDSLKEFESNKDTYLSNKKLLVHSSIVNNDGDIIIDTTEEFRKFCYYYESDLELIVFFNYIQTILKRRNIDSNIFDEKFTIYLNDATFTEYTYPIRENMYTSFKTVFDPKKFV